MTTTEAINTTDILRFKETKRITKLNVEAANTKYDLEYLLDSYKAHYKHEQKMSQVFMQKEMRNGYEWALEYMNLYLQLIERVEKKLDYYNNISTH